MTYEKFCSRVLNMPDISTTRKDIRSVVIRSLIFIAEFSYTLGYLVGCAFSSFALVSGCLLFGVLAFILLDFISESSRVYLIWSKISKLWVLFLPITIVLILTMKLFLR